MQVVMKSAQLGTKGSALYLVSHVICDLGIQTEQYKLYNFQELEALKVLFAM